MLANGLLEGEYAKRVWLDKIDGENLLNFLEPYKENGVLNLSRIEQEGVLDTYNLLSYLQVSSALKKDVLENFIIKKSSELVPPEKSFVSDIHRLKELETKTALKGISGGFVDELEVSETGSSSHLVVFDETIDTTGKPIDEQISMYERELERMLVQTLQENNQVDTLSGICKRVALNKDEILDIITKEIEARKKPKESVNKYQKIITE